MRSLLVLLLLLVSRPVFAHDEVLRDLPELAAGADVVVRGRVVQVVADRGTRGPRLVSVVVERALAGDPGAQALTFRAPVEHGEGWRVGEHALFFVKQWQGGWLATAIAAESPRVGTGGVAALDARWAEAVRGPRLAEEKDELSVPGLFAGGFCFVGLLWLGRRRVVRDAAARPPA